MCRWYVVELDTRNLWNFIDRCNPSKANLKKRRPSRAARSGGASSRCAQVAGSTLQQESCAR